MDKQPSLLKIGNETYGTIKVEDAFRRALEPYFEVDKKLLLSKT